MSAAVQLVIVIIVGIVAFGYAIFKIVNMVRRRNEPASPCAGCDVPCKIREIKSQKVKK